MTFVLERQGIFEKQSFRMLYPKFHIMTREKQMQKEKKSHTRRRKTSQECVPTWLSEIWVHGLICNLRDKAISKSPSSSEPQKCLAVHIKGHFSRLYNKTKENSALSTAICCEKF